MNDTGVVNTIGHARFLAELPGAEALLDVKRSPWERGQTITLVITAYQPDPRPAPIPSAPTRDDGDVIVRGGADA